MAKTKPDVEHAQKRDALVAVAETLFHRDGYEATSMAKIAAKAGVAINTLYWYFADKDALLVAVLNRIVAARVSEFMTHASEALDEQLLWLLDLLVDVRPLITTVHARAAASSEIRAWHDNFHRFIEAQVVSQLQRSGTADADAAPAAVFAMFAVEGFLTHDYTATQRRELVQWLVRQLPVGNQPAPTTGHGKQ